MQLVKQDPTANLIDILVKSSAENHYVDILKTLESEIRSNVSLWLDQRDYECKIVDTVLTKTVWPVADKLVYSFLPFLFVIVFNVLIIKNISKVQKYKYILYVSRLRNEMLSNISIKNVRQDDPLFNEFMKNQKAIRKHIQYVLIHC